MLITIRKYKISLVNNQHLKTNFKIKVLKTRKEHLLNQAFHSYFIEEYIVHLH